MEASAAVQSPVGWAMRMRSQNHTEQVAARQLKAAARNTQVGAGTGAAQRDFRLAFTGVSSDQKGLASIGYKPQGPRQRRSRVKVPLRRMGSRFAWGPGGFWRT